MALGIGHVRNLMFTPRLHPSFVYPVSILAFWLWFRAFSAKLNGDNLEMETDCPIMVLKSLFLGTDVSKFEELAYQLCNLSDTYFFIGSSVFYCFTVSVQGRLLRIKGSPRVVCFCEHCYFNVKSPRLLKVLT